jgi:hypothetical protein
MDGDLLGSESLYRKIISPKMFYRKAIWPKHHLTEHRLTECHLTERSFDRITNYERRLTESSFYRKVFFLQKMVFWPNLFSTKNVIWPKKNAHKVVWPKVHLTESFFWEWSFDRKFIWSKAFFEKLSFYRKIIWPKAHLTEWFFWNIVVFEKFTFDRYSGAMKEKIVPILSLLLFQSCREYDLRNIL